MSDSTYQLQIKISKLHFGVSNVNNQIYANIKCCLIGRNINYHFKTRAIYDKKNNRWILRGNEHRWLEPVSSDFTLYKNLNSIYQELIKAFIPVWLKGNLIKGKKGAEVIAGQSNITHKQSKKSFLIFRPHIKDFYTPDWKLLWELIINRIEYDPEFSIKGIHKSTIKKSVDTIKSLYSWQWVKKRYELKFNKYINHKSKISIKDTPFFFPAILIARTASGEVCKDPGWNYLVSLADGINAVKKFPNGKKLLKTYPITQGIEHQISFAGYLYQKGIMTNINQPTGSGNDKHDFAVKIGTKTYDIELKALTSLNPGLKLKKEITKRSRRLPNQPDNPIVYYVILIDSHIPNIIEYENKTVKDFLSEITLECFSNSKNIAAIVAGQMFTDSSGGKLKWSFDKFLINNLSKPFINESELRQIFVSNWKKLSYPLIPITFKYLS